MLREDQNRPHRDTVSYIRSTIHNKFNTYRKHIDAAKDIETLDDAHEAHIRAKTAFSTVNSDRTMINLIGTWARLNRVIMEMDDKYGRRE